jgi:hypothetical protein
MTTLSTLIIYAGVMQYLIREQTVSGRLKDLTTSESLVALSAIQKLLPDPMSRTLLRMLGIYSSMKSQRLLGICPVTTEYERLPPLFYYLSGTEALYYTVGDTLQDVKKVPISDSARDSILAKIKHYEGEIRNPSITATEKDIHIRDIRILREQLESFYFTKGSKNEIVHKELPALTKEERIAIVTGPDSPEGLKAFISECRKKFNSITAVGVSPSDLTRFTDEPFFTQELSPFFNYNMSITQTFAKVRDHRLTSAGRHLSTKRPFESLRLEYEEARSTLTTLSGMTIKKDEDDVKKAKRIKNTEDALDRLIKLTDRFSDQRTSIISETMAELQQPMSVWVPISE